jgi:MFS family permease
MIGRKLLRGYSPAFYLAFLSCVLLFSSGSLLITTLPLYIEHIGGGPVEVGLSGTATALCALTVRPCMGRLSDTRGRRATLIIGTVTFLLTPLGYAASGSIPLFLAVRALQGIGIAAYTSAYGAFIADVTPPSRWGEALGIAGTGPALSMMIASPVGAALVDPVGFHGLFLIAAAIALAALGVTLLLREPATEPLTRHEARPGYPRIRELAGLRGVLVPSLATLTLGVTNGTTNTFLPLLTRDRGLGNAGFFFTTTSLLAILSGFGMGRLSDRYGRVTVILPMLFVLAIGCWGLNWTYTFGMLLVMAAVTGLGSGGSRVGLETMLVDAAPAGLRGMAFSLLYLCFDIGIGTGSMAGGLLASLAGYGTLYALVGVLCLLTAAAFGAVMRGHVPDKIRERT